MNGILKIKKIWQRDDNNNFVPYAIGYSNVKMFYKDNNQNVILYCFKDNYFHNHTFYAHNMGKFDGLLMTTCNHGFSFELMNSEAVGYTIK